MSCSAPSYSQHSAPIGVSTIANPAPGCSPATIGRIGRSIRKPFGTHVRKPPSAPASKNAFIPTLFVTVLRHISMKPAPIYVHLAIKRLNATASPLDSLTLNDKPPDE